MLNMIKKLMAAGALIATSSCFASFNQVAVLGESFSSSEASGVNEEVLGRLFALIRGQSPAAVVFTGNMLLGLTVPDTVEKVHSSSDSHLPMPARELDGSLHPLTYSSANYRSQLQRFLNLKKQYLDASQPFYPIIGKHEAFGIDAIELVLESFSLKNQASPTASPLAYLFSVDNALFILFSIAYYDAAAGKPSLHRLSPQLLEWLDCTLFAWRSRYDFVFIVGNEPAFSTAATEGQQIGLDQNRRERDRFWEILRKHAVTAYFCSGQPVYDVTNRFGVWQVISGGAGASPNDCQDEQSFYHYLLLTIPSTSKNNPRIQVYGPQGSLYDDLELTPARGLVYD